MIEEAKYIFEDTNKAHYKNYPHLEHAVKEIVSFWQDFNTQQGVTVGFLHQHESLYDVVKSVVSHMRTPLLIGKRHKEHMKEVCEQTQAIVDKATKLRKSISESVIRLDMYQGEDDQGFPSTPPTTTLHLKDSGFEQLSRCLVAGKAEHLAQCRKLEVDVYWEVPLAMTRYKQSQGFGPIVTISGNQTDAQAATACDYLQEHTSCGDVLLKAIQKAWNSSVCVDIEKPAKALQHLTVQTSGKKKESENHCNWV